jgi:molecular chaperone DnaK
LPRGKLEDIVGPIVMRCRGPIDRVLSDARLTSKDISKIILVGGRVVNRALATYVPDERSGSGITSLKIENLYYP